MEDANEHGNSRIKVSEKKVQEPDELGQGENLCTLIKDNIVENV